MTRSRPRAAAILVLVPLALPLLAGCGGDAVPSAAAPSGSEDLSTPEGAIAAVDQAERAIDQLFGPTQSRTISQQAGAFAQAPTPQSALPAAPPAQPPPPPPPPEPAPAADSTAKEAPARASSAKKAAGGEAVRGAGAAVDPCSTACSALASMERATEHLCTLAGAADARCTSARTRVKSATDRVRASCPSCG